MYAQTYHVQITYLRAQHLDKGQYCAVLGNQALIVVITD